MTELLTAAQMRAIEEAAIASGEVTGLELMERAGRGVVEEVFREWPDLATGSHRAMVLCGPGNNGGDGFVVARLLKTAGWAVAVFFYGKVEKLSPDARANYDRWAGATAGVTKVDRRIDPGGLAKADLVVDALFGIGRLRGPTGDLHRTLAILAERAPDATRLVAVDTPSGLCADSGRAIFEGAPGKPDAVQANLTVTFHRAKVGHYLADGPTCSGVVRVKDIGIQQADVVGPDQGEIVQLTAKPSRSFKQANANKFTHGHALILSGGVCRTGAARLAARGALRIGAGLVTLGVPPPALLEVASQITALMLTEVPDAQALQRFLNDDRINALCLGPGLGLDGGPARLVAQALTAGRATVLDADALTLIAADRALFAALHEKCVLTPHGGEFARVFPDLSEKLAARPVSGLAYSKVDATRDAAKRAGCTVLFKGPDTVIADPSGRCAINSAHYDRAAPWLATAGSGDVLAGFITGLLARGFNPMQAAETAAWLHVECASRFGPGLIAEDLPEQLPAVLQALNAS